MTKKNLFKLIAIAFLLFMLVGLVFFRKGDDKNLNPKPIPANNQQTEKPEKKRELTEEEKLKIFAENFVATYYSYIWGNFSNVESQYYYMTEEMKSREEIKVKKMKKEIEGQPRRYFTARARLLNSSFALDKETKANLSIDLSVDNFAGAIVQRDTMVWVDKNGDYYEGDIDKLIIDTTEKNVEVVLVKISDEWKVDWIEEK
ncbi:MAG: hypothetical protein U9N04_03335 [Patescibacteria group bacterium]|nr:hypothetical protein [Patescibacteria group bacterium]